MLLCMQLKSLFLSFFESWLKGACKADKSVDYLDSLFNLKVMAKGKVGRMGSRCSKKKPKRMCSSKKRRPSKKRCSSKKRTYKRKRKMCGRGSGRVMSKIRKGAKFALKLAPGLALGGAALAARYAVGSLLNSGAPSSYPTMKKMSGKGSGRMYGGALIPAGGRMPPPRRPPRP